MKFEWDENKNQINWQKHGFNFNDAKEFFANEFWAYEDVRQDYGEKRMIGYGFVRDRLMAVAYTNRHPNICRLISFRRANSREEALYEKYCKNT